MVFHETNLVLQDRIDKLKNEFVRVEEDIEREATELEEKERIHLTRVNHQTHSPEDSSPSVVVVEDQVQLSREGSAASKSEKQILQKTNSEEARSNNGLEDNNRDSRSKDRRSSERKDKDRRSLERKDWRSSERKDRRSSERKIGEAQKEKIGEASKGGIGGALNVKTGEAPSGANRTREAKAVAAARANRLPPAPPPKRAAVRVRAGTRNTSGTTAITTTEKIARAATASRAAASRRVEAGRGAEAAALTAAEGRAAASTPTAPPAPRTTEVTAREDVAPLPVPTAASNTAKPPIEDRLSRARFLPPVHSCLHPFRLPTFASNFGNSRLDFEGLSTIPILYKTNSMN
uniref:Uncharacterized protein n=1 Tax=Lygus hesperus TaxID=30085 RepID=A0A0A9WNS9_LYGHE